MYPVIMKDVGNPSIPIVKIKLSLYLIKHHAKEMN
jgi:hypothetical protein